MPGIGQHKKRGNRGRATGKSCKKRSLCEELQEEEKQKKRNSRGRRETEEEEQLKRMSSRKAGLRRGAA